MKNKKLLLVCLLLILTTTLTGCTAIDKGLVKLGFRNNDFDYMVNSKIDKIIIQNSRDTGFRFVVTDENAIKDIYEILKKGKIRDKKSSLDPDYVFEVHMVGDKVKKYSYVVSSTEKGRGNFYSKNKAYEISKNLDATILQNLEFIRKPRSFEDIYYNSILKVVDKIKGDISDGNKVGIDISGDVDCLKYMFSVDLQSFKKELSKKISNIDLVKNNTDKFDTVISVNNNGYSTKLFKTTIIVDNKKDKIYQTYYVKGTYEYKKWDITVSKPDEKPSDW